MCYQGVKEIHIFKQYYMVCVHQDVKPSHCILFLFLDEKGDRVVTEQTRFCSTVFLCSKFQSEYIYSGVNFCGKNVCVNFFLQMARKITKFEPAKISCLTVSLVDLNFVCFVGSLSLFWRKKILKKIIPFVGEKLQCI